MKGFVLIALLFSLSHAKAQTDLSSELSSELAKAYQEQADTYRKIKEALGDELPLMAPAGPRADAAGLKIRLVKVEKRSATYGIHSNELRE